MWIFFVVVDLSVSYKDRKRKNLVRKCRDKRDGHSTRINVITCKTGKIDIGL